MHANSEGVLEPTPTDVEVAQTALLMSINQTTFSCQDDSNSAADQEKSSRR
jgi:hypothetical protein